MAQLQEQLNVTISESKQIEQNGQLMLEKSATIEKEIHDFDTKIHDLQLRIAPESCEQLAHQGITESKNVFLDPDGRYKNGIFNALFNLIGYFVLETRGFIKISTHPCYPINVD